MAVALIDSPDAVNGDQTLRVDHFGLSIGSVSVGLPLAGTSDDVYRRYLDLLRLLQRGPLTTLPTPEDDLRTLAIATSTTPAYVARRLSALGRR